MMKIGITGQSGFIGTHLYNYIGLQSDVKRIPFKDEYFNDKKYLREFVKQCDVIVHLAAMNRNPDPQLIYETNISLVKKLITACEETNSMPHILFSSSTQEKKNDFYGKSKYEGRKLFEKWAERNSTKFTGLIIPNVFGPFGKPYYNSFIATFCYQLTHNEQPHIEVDSEVKLIYIGELVEVIWAVISGQRVSQRGILWGGEGTRHCKTLKIEHTKQIKVSEVLVVLKDFAENYLKKGIIPDLKDSFNGNLFKTFVTYIDLKNFFPFHLIKKSDNRGTFVEIIKLNTGGQISFSTTKPCITRGNHFHTRKAERFAVIKGKAMIELRRIGTDEVLSFELDGENPSFVDIPVWYTHNITNIGDDDLFTIFWINEHYDSEDSDTFFEKV